MDRIDPETRGYNRGAGAASGRVVIFLQDDDVPRDGCKGWVKDVVALFDAHKRLGVVGMKKACFARWGGVGTSPRVYIRVYIHAHTRAHAHAHTHAHTHARVPVHTHRNTF